MAQKSTNKPVTPSSAGPQVGVFGYGSLVNIQSLATTLGREPDATYYVSLNGWMRDWTVRCRNDSPYARFHTSDGRIPDYVLALNVQRQGMGVATNGILFAVNEVDLRSLDTRETNYNRIDVTDQIVGDHPFDIVYTYTGKPEALVSAADRAIIPASYLSVVESGFQELGERAEDAYRTSTLESGFEIVDTTYVVY
jgi:hypothetical protein